MNQHSSSQLVKQLTRPSDYVEVAKEKTDDIDHSNGHWVVRHNGRAVGFSDHGNREYSREYRHLLIRAFRAAGLLALLVAALRLAIT